VTLEHRGTRAGHRGHGTCHRCGWVVDVTRISRKRARQLHMGSHAARICDECLDDLQSATIVTLGADTRQHAVVGTAHNRVVA